MRTRAVGAHPSVTLREWGDGRPAVFLHSMGPVSSGAMVGASVGSLVDAGFAVIAPDLPGYGDTEPLEPEQYEIGALAARMWDVATAAGLDSVVLIGHSWGGAIACRMHALDPERVDALALVDSGHLDYADVVGDDLALTLDDWIARARDRRLRIPDIDALAKELELDVDDPILDLLLVGVEYDGEGLVSRARPEGQGAAFYHLARARQSETWAGIAAARTPTLLLLATEPESALRQNEEAAARFRAAVPQADVRMIEGATHSLVTDLRERFGQIVAEWLTAG